MGTVVPPKPRTLAELLPGLSGIMSKDAMQTLTARKQPRPAKPATLTAEKVFKPMTIAEMREDLKALKLQSPRMLAQGATSTKKKWNSSVKVEKKTVSHTADGQMKHNTVRKVLNFQQPKPKIPRIVLNNARMTMNSVTPKFPRPEMKTKKSLRVQATNSVRISGICHIPDDTPLSKKPVKTVMCIANKENVSNQPLIKKVTRTPKSSLHKRIMASRNPDTPVSNVSWKSSCDASFLQYEKDIEFNEGKNKDLTEEHTHEHIAEVSPPVSTPFKEYQNIKEFFNGSSDLMDNSPTVSHDNTIMCFDKTSVVNENSKREESVIVSLCDMLNKATVSHLNTKKTSTELDDLLEFQEQTVKHLQMIENGIAMLRALKESQLKSLEHVKKLIHEKQNGLTSESNNDKTVNETINNVKMEVEITPYKSPVASKTCSVIKSCLKSPSYKIPKKNMSCNQKKVYYRSMPNFSDLNNTPTKPMGDRALNMYMKMKENMNFLTTPVVKKKSDNVPTTPALTSNNLQQQLERLYGES